MAISHPGGWRRTLLTDDRKPPNWSHRDERPDSTRRMRWKGFDYRTPGYYHITMCTEGRRHLLSIIHRGEVRLLPGGRVIEDSMLRLPERFTSVHLDTSVIMPDHVHLFLGNSTRIADDGREPVSVIHVLHWFKTQTTNAYIRGVKRSDWPRFDGRFWQEGYNDQFVRSDQELEAIRHYIWTNPDRWGETRSDER